MKILLISPLPPPYGGIANWSKLMLEYTNNANDEICVLNIAPKKRSTEGRNLFDRVVVSGFDMLRKRKELKKKIKEYKPDVIHMTTSGSISIIRDLMFLKIAYKYGIQTVYHIHFGKVPQMEKSGSFIWKLFLKAINRASATIAIDSRTYNSLGSYISKEKSFLVPNPVNTEALPEITTDKKNTVTFLGWVVATKGVEELIFAWNIVGREYPMYELVLIGPAKEEYLSELTQKAKVENITFKGELPHNEAMGILSDSKVFVLPSYTEGFPNSILEAMALKNTVIASNVGAVPEMLSGECGVIIEPRSADSIVFALRKVLNNSEYCAQLAQNAFDKVENEYTIDKVYRMYKEIWENVL